MIARKTPGKQNPRERGRARWEGDVEPVGVRWGGREEGYPLTHQPCPFPPSRGSLGTGLSESVGAQHLLGVWVGSGQGPSARPALPPSCDTLREELSTTGKARAVPGDARRRRGWRGAAGKAGLVPLGRRLGTVAFFLPTVLSFHFLFCLQAPPFLPKRDSADSLVGPGLPCALGR